MSIDIGIFSFGSTVDEVVARAADVHAQGFASMYLPQIFGLDALTTIAVAAREVPDLRFVTDVVPAYRQHPMMLAQQALTVSQASGGRLDLGIGLSHQVVVEGMWGLSYDKPLRYMREYLDVLMPLLDGEPVSASGDVVSGRGALEVEGPPVPVLVAALGPQMLKLAGKAAHGTTTWMVGPKTLSEHIVPTISEAAASNGRPAPRVSAALPVCVTSDVAGARERAAKEFVIYGQLPSYRAMLDREGGGGPEDIAAIGSPEQVIEQINVMMEAGATTFVANEFGTGEERAASREVLRSLL